MSRYRRPVLRRHQRHDVLPVDGVLHWDPKPPTKRLERPPHGAMVVGAFIEGQLRKEIDDALAGVLPEIEDRMRDAEIPAPLDHVFQVEALDVEADDRAVLAGVPERPERHALRVFITARDVVLALLRPPADRHDAPDV